MTTLLVLYRRPEGGPDALAEFERRYASEHMPLVAQTPGLRATRVQRVSGALGSETDLALVTAMDFEDRAGPRNVPRRRRRARPAGCLTRRPTVPRPWILSAPRRTQ